MKNFIKDILFSVKNEKYHKVITCLGVKLKFRTGKPNILNYLEIDIVDHCNLNCEGCSHFCPITENAFMNIEHFKKDLKAVSEKFETIKQIRILGGEPLLHPDINWFMHYSRELYPYADIRIVTNGILLSKMSDEFWDTVNKNKITVDLSKYPIAGDKFSLGLDKIAEKHAKLGFIHLCSTFWRTLISTGTSPINETFQNCTLKNCTSLRNGRLYCCPTGAFIYRYNKYFNTNIPEEKGIDVYESTAEQIKNYLKTPFETCKYCVTEKDFKFLAWKVSIKDKNEWFADKI